MQGIKDIRVYKREMRKKQKQLRRTMEPEDKNNQDARIARRVTGLWQFKEAETLFTYVSTEIEVDTFSIMHTALEQGKRVAVPYCLDGTCLMDFYYITSLEEDLEKRTFGVLEPRMEQCEKVSDFSAGLCIVPGLSFDFQGYRLGYGKGYYDRFLPKFQGETVGVCYQQCMERLLPHGRFDRPVDLLVTPRFIRSTRRK